MSQSELAFLEGLSAIVEEIVNDVKSSVERTLSQAEERSIGVLSEARERARAIYEERLSAAKSRAEIEYRKIVSSAEVEAKMSLLRAKDEIVRQVFDVALQKLREYAKTEDYYERCLPRLISEGAKCLKSDEVVAYLNKKDRRRLGKGALEQLSKDVGVKVRVSDKAISCVGGVVVERADGKASYDNTFEKILRELEPKLRVKLADMLFKEG